MNTFISNAQQDIKIISNQISDLLHKEDVYQKRIVPQIRNKSLDTYSANAIANNHYSAVMVAIRRQLGTQRQEISLLNLLKKLEKNNKLITIKWYCKEWLKDSSLLKNSEDELKSFVKNLPAAEFEEYFGISILKKNIVKRDIAKLKSATKKIKLFVDKRLAHYDKKGPKSIKEKDYLKALKSIEQITKKYILLLEQSGVVNLTPVMQ